MLFFWAGPILLEDYHVIEKLAQFDRERIPERVVHARGASAKGFFEVTHDISHLTCADFLRAPGVQTPVIVRFSTVIHERGSPETLRDPRGFAVKFYTREVLESFFSLCHKRQTNEMCIHCRNQPMFTLSECITEKENVCEKKIM